MISLFKVAMDPSASEAVGEVLDSGYIGQGPKVEEFEKKVTEELGVEGRRLLSVNSCTSALDLSMHMCGVHEGEEVVATPMTCTATNAPLSTRRARITWADVDPMTGLIDPEDVKRKISSKTKAIVAVNWAGRSCDYRSLRVISGRYGIPIIEDAAHCWRTRYDGKATGSGYGGDYVCWSLQAIKFLTCGDGGLLSVPDAHYQRAKLLRWFGLDRELSDSFRCSQTIGEVGFKYQMNDIAASIALSNIELARKNVKRHQDNAKYYCDNLDPKANVRFPSYDPNCSYWVFTVLVKERDEFMKFMAEQDIVTSPVHSRCDYHPPFDFYSGELPGVDFFSSREVCIPCGWWISDEERAHIARTITLWNEKN